MWKWFARPRRYAFLFEGGNLLVPVEGEIRRSGFFVTRFVGAADKETAQALAEQAVRQMFHEQAQNEPDDPPQLALQEWSERTQGGEWRPPGSGLILVPLDEEDADGSENEEL